MADPIKLVDADVRENPVLLTKLAGLVPRSRATLGRVAQDETESALATAWVKKHLGSTRTRAWVNSLDWPSAFLCHQDKPWDTEVLGMSVGAVTCFLVDQTSLDAASSLARAYVSWATEAGCRLLSARLDPGQIAAIQALESAGFRFVEIYVTLERDVVQHPPREIGVDVVAADDTDAEMVGEMAGRTFVYDRLHADPRVNDRYADAFKRAWGANSCRGYADRVLLARVDGHVAGFVTLRKKDRGIQGDEVALIDLIGVLGGFQGQGVGSALVEAGCRWAQEQGLQAVEVGTQGANVPSLGLYRKCGFREVDLHVTLHWLAEGGVQHDG